jgi:hypothetical protein
MLCAVVYKSEKPAISIFRVHYESSGVLLTSWTYVQNYRASPLQRSNLDILNFTVHRNFLNFTDKVISSSAQSKYILDRTDPSVCIVSDTSEWISAKLSMEGVRNFNIWIVLYLCSRCYWISQNIPAYKEFMHGHRICREIKCKFTANWLGTPVEGTHVTLVHLNFAHFD